MDTNRHESFRPESLRGFGVRRLDAAFRRQTAYGKVSGINEQFIWQLRERPSAALLQA